MFISAEMVSGWRDARRREIVSWPELRTLSTPTDDPMSTSKDDMPFERDKIWRTWYGKINAGHASKCRVLFCMISPPIKWIAVGMRVWLFHIVP